jgi:beta-glucanase (GH16 family)
MKTNKIICLISILFFTSIYLTSFAADKTRSKLPGGNNKWQLFWHDEFNYPNNQLESNWISANDSTSTNILCARIRRNAIVSNGTLKLLNKKEKVGKKDWTSGSVWTKLQFKYGYFECRYKYAAVTGTNNSFWLKINGSKLSQGKKFEIDINEGHFPSIMATNIHNWSDITTLNGVSKHKSSGKAIPLTNLNLGAEYHIYGLKWTPDSLCFYFDGKEVRRVHNDFCYSAATIYLSEAIIAWAGPVKEAIDGTRMEIDYVRVYKELPSK